MSLIVGKTNLIYGEAGVGKTNLSLWLMSALANGSSRSIYISTEGTSYASVLDRYGFYGNELFVTAYSSSDLLQLIIDIYFRYAKELKIVVIDSINSFYRSDSTLTPGINRIYNSMLSLINDLVLNNGITCILTAQVSSSDEDITVSGISLLRYWCDTIIRLQRVKGIIRKLTIEFPESIGLTLYYSIDKEGIKWAEDEH